MKKPISNTMSKIILILKAGRCQNNVASNMGIVISNTALMADMTHSNQGNDMRKKYKWVFKKVSQIEVLVGMWSATVVTLRK